MRIQVKVKRLIDILAAIIILITLMPIIILTICLIYVFEGRPILYNSERLISSNKAVTIYKFRSMVRNARDPKYKLEERFFKDGYLDIPLECEVYTNIGRIIERTQLVEILQLLNVLIDGMSLIGNRPLPKKNVEELMKFNGWSKRFESPAGLTGISQIVGKNILSGKDRLELESLYSEVYKNGSILYLDFIIMIHTIKIIIFRKTLSPDAAKNLMTSLL
jgi:lipopolysaccharide/colanic/teichoic acid biosynthesis glycosyltransferase